LATGLQGLGIGVTGGLPGKSGFMDDLSEVLGLFGIPNILHSP
jgi:hypothetical protein